MAAPAAVQENPLEKSRYRRPRTQNPSPSPSSDPNPQISQLLQQSTRCKSTISSLFLSTFTTTTNNTSNMASSNVSLQKKTKMFTSATFRGLGCATSSQVSAPAVIRTSADWQAKKGRKKKQRRKNHQPTMISTTHNSTPVVVVVPDVWCSPGIAFSSDAASVDCVVSRRPVQQSRGRIEGGERVNHSHRERPCSSRRNANLEHVSILDSPSMFEMTNIESDVFGARHHRHFRHRSPGGISEIMMFQSSLLLGGRSAGFDRHRDLRLDVDSMTYEDLLELGDKIGYVSTGLREDEISHCLRITKHSIVDASQPQSVRHTSWKCSICQEEYELNDDVGKLACGHSYHLCCIEQWLLQKNTCPICKVAATAQH